MRYVKLKITHKQLDSSYMTTTPTVKPVRLQKYLADCGICSRRQAEIFIEEGRVMVNGSLATLGMKVTDQDKISVDGKEIITSHKEKAVYLVYKPRGVTSSTKDIHAEHLVTSLVPSEERLYPVGRLDRDSEGLIILTNDGNLTFTLTHPSFEISKKYHVFIEPGITNGDVEKLKKGIIHDREKLLLDDIHMLNPREVVITLHHGKNRHIRRMFAALRYEVIRLIRTSIGPLTLADLAGKPYLRLTSDQVSSIVN